MILATVGAQMPFPRLISALDEWAIARDRTDVFAQIGPTSDHPHRLHWVNFLSPREFRAKVQQADAVIAHAGMGTIITALCLRKPIIVMPRRGDLLETRNDHQIATAAQFASRSGFVVAQDRDELFDRLDRLAELSAPQGIANVASDELLGAVRSFILGSPVQVTAAARIARAATL